MSRLTVLIIGGTSGVGKATAGQLADAGHRVLGIGRDRDRARSLDADLRQTGGAASAVDVAARPGWDTTTEWASQHTDHLDVLINAAGVMLPDRRTTSEGVELNFAIHHLAPFALTGQLLPLLRRGAVPDGPDGASLPRVININSAGHQASLAGHINPILDFTDLQSANSYDPFLAYSRSKLANLLFTYELVRRHGDELAIAAMHPGVARTNLGRNFPRIRVAAAQAFAISPRRSAHSVVRLATQPLPRNGQYFDQSTPARSSPPSHDPDAAARLWAITKELCGPFQPQDANRHATLPQTDLSQSKSQSKERASPVDRSKTTRFGRPASAITAAGSIRGITQQQLRYTSEALPGDYHH